VWDVAAFDQAPLSEARVTAVTRWTSIGTAGTALSPQVQFTIGGSQKPDVELIAYDLAFLPGGYVV
jgi:hypothetical protein